MKTGEIIDPLFRAAVEALDRGDMSALENLLVSHPEITSTRLDTPAEGYFKHPYLMCFIADNPIRNGKLPANIVAMTRLILQVARQHARDTYQEQIEYTLGLTETGRITRECGVQIELINLLVDHGATPGTGHGALIHGNIEAARHIIEKSGIVTLTAALCLDRTADIPQLLETATKDDKQIALMATAFYGKPKAVAILILSGADVNAYIDHGFHTHASPLHQAVFSGSLETVKLLAEAGANLKATDKEYGGTPLGWAIHMQKEMTDEVSRPKFTQIERYLESLDKLQ
jgi:peptide-methionine (S)-S-oxide reductase